MAKIDNKAKKSIAEKLYIEDGLSGKDVADMVGTSPQTISRWKTEGDWDARRDELLAAPHKLREILLKELRKIAEGEKSTIDADALAKINKVIETVSDKISVPVAFSVFKEFDNWMADQDPKTAVLFTEYHKQFLQYKISLE